jgi:hypothetical protein
MSAEPLREVDDAMIEATYPLDGPNEDEIERVAAGEAAEQEPDSRPWVPDSLMAADWVGRKVRKARKGLDENERVYREQLALLDAWKRDADRPHLATEAWGQQVLELYLAREIEQDDAAPDRKRKSRTLPCGVKLQRRDGQPKLEVDDADAFLRWMRTYRPDLVTEKTEYRWSRRDVTQKLRTDDDRIVAPDPETGEIVEAAGVRVTRRPSFSLGVMNQPGEGAGDG